MATGGAQDEDHRASGARRAASTSASASILALAEHRFAAAGRRSSRSGNRCCPARPADHKQTGSLPTRRPSGRGTRRTRAGRGSRGRARGRRSARCPALAEGIRARLSEARRCSSRPMRPELFRGMSPIGLATPSPAPGGALPVPVLDARQGLADELQPGAVEDQDTPVCGPGSIDRRQEVLLLRVPSRARVLVRKLLLEQQAGPVDAGCGRLRCLFRAAGRRLAERPAASAPPPSGTPVR
jgi:hypothetical protein